MSAMVTMLRPGYSVEMPRLAIHSADIAVVEAADLPRNRRLFGEAEMHASNERRFRCNPEMLRVTRRAAIPAQDGKPTTSQRTAVDIT